MISKTLEFSLIIVFAMILYNIQVGTSYKHDL